MRFSHYFLKTSKTVSAEDTIISARLLKQAGFIRESTAGRFYFLPAGVRVQQKIMRIIKEEMDAAGCQEMSTPILHPLELWKETNRSSTAAFELMKVVDRRDGEFVLGGTAEEMFVDLVRQYTFSYRDLPFSLYQFSQKFRDELRARGGLLRVREFIMKDGYSFHCDEDDFKKEYEKMKKVYTRIFKRCGLTTRIVESDNGYIGGDYCHELIVDSDSGESRYVVAESSDYAAHEDVAIFLKEDMNKNAQPLPLEEVDAHRGPTMDDGVALHGLPLWQQLKDVVFVDELGRFILAIIRGDFDVNETKLAHLVGAHTLRHATDDEIRNDLHSEPGFISPVGITEKISPSTKLVIVADDSLGTVINMYGGSNKKNRDLLNVNLYRDYSPDVLGDIALVRAGYLAREGGGVLSERKGIEVGNIFQLGYHYTNLMKGAVYVDSDGHEKPFYMGCYGIGIGRTLASIVECHHDDRGIIWPQSIAPFSVFLIALDGGFSAAETLYTELVEAGVEVLYDDRDKGAGEKFADADLVGIPIRVVISKKTLLQNSGEVKLRTEKESSLHSLVSLSDHIRSIISSFEQ